MPKEKVYLETSVISYLTARPCRDIVKLAKQQLTREWWETRRGDFELFVSRPVRAEIQDGDPEAARLRMESVAGLQEIVVTDKAAALTKKLLSSGAVPLIAAVDASHIAVSAVHGIAYLLTWNCAHINNPATKGKIAEIIAEAGYTNVEIATPEQLLWRQDYERTGLGGRGRPD